MYAIGQQTNSIAFRTRNGYDQYFSEFKNPESEDSFRTGDIYWKQTIVVEDGYEFFDFIFVQVVASIDGRIFYKAIDYIFDDCDRDDSEEVSMKSYWFPLRSLYIDDKIDVAQTCDFCEEYSVYRKNKSSVSSYSIDLGYWD